MPCKSFMIADLLSEEFESKSPICTSSYYFLRARGNGVELNSANHVAWLWHWLQPNAEDRFSPSKVKAPAEVPIPPYVRGDKNSSVLNCTPKRRNRTVFTDVQLQGLEKMFEKQRYLSSEARTQLAISLGLTQLQVKTWYQNRRMKWKKEHQQRKQNRSLHPKTLSCSA